MRRRKRAWRPVETAIHTDQDFQALPRQEPNPRSLFMYLLTSPHHTPLPGLIVARPAVVADDLRWSVAELQAQLGELEAGGFVMADLAAGLIVLSRSMFSRRGEARETVKPYNPNVVKSWGTAFNEVPDCNLKVEYFQQLKPFVEGFGESFGEAFAESFTEPFVRRNPGGGVLVNVNVPVRDQDQGSEIQGSEIQGSGGETTQPAEDPPPPKAKRKPLPPHAVELAEELRASVARQWPQQSKAGRGLTELQQRSWGETIDKLIRIDGYSSEQVRYAIDWLEKQTGDVRFIVQSAASLRKKMDRIAAVIANQVKSGTGASRAHGISAMAAAAEAEEGITDADE